MNSKKERVIKIGSRVLFWIVLGAFLAFILLPMFWVIGASLRPNAEISASTISLSINSFIPEIFTLEAYINIFTIRTFGK